MHSSPLLFCVMTIEVCVSATQHLPQLFSNIQTLLSLVFVQHRENLKEYSYKSFRIHGCCPYRTDIHTFWTEYCHQHGSERHRPVPCLSYLSITSMLFHNIPYQIQNIILVYYTVSIIVTPLYLIEQNVHAVFCKNDYGICPCWLFIFTVFCYFFLI